MFDWQTEDENGSWDDEPAVTQAAPLRRRRPWVFTLVMVVVVTLAGVVVYRQVQVQVDKTSVSMEEQVMAAHTFVHAVAAEQDEELFRAQLSGRDPRWTEAQQELLTNGLIFDRYPLGLQAVTTLTETLPVSVTLAADLKSAEVVETLPYTVEVTPGVTETVWLQQTAVYRASQTNRWLLSPPMDDFWGGWATINTQFLTLVFPIRDQKLAEELAFDLDTLIRRVCQTVQDTICLQDLRLNLRFTTELQSLIDLADPTYSLQPHFPMELPTPTLIGLPIDEAGYQALYRGYGVQIASSLIVQLTGYECCERAVFYQAMLDKQLSGLGLHPWLSPADYEQVLMEGLQTIPPHLLYRTENNNREWRLVYTLVDYLSQTTPVVQMQDELVTWSSYDRWIEALIGPDIDILPPWQQFVYEHSLSGQSTEPPISWPAADVLLVCPTVSNTGTAVHRYNIASNTWVQDFIRQYDLAYSLDFQVLPNNNGYLFHRTSPDYTERQLIWWHDGVEVVITSTINLNTNLYYTHMGDPFGRYHVIGTIEENSTTAANMLDLENCTDSSCPLTPLNTVGWLVHWSPNSKHTLMNSFPSEDANFPEAWLNSSLYVADEAGSSPVVAGAGPGIGWLDNNTFIYIHPVDAATTELIATNVNDMAPQVLLEEADLQAVLPETTEENGRLMIWYAQLSTNNPYNLLVVAASADDMTNSRYSFFHLLYSPNDPQNSQLTFITTTSGWAEISPNGRWLVLQNYNDLSLPGVQFLNLETKEVQPFFPDPNMSGNWGWSPDGLWVVQYYDEYLVFTAPDHAYRRTVPHQLRDCYDVQWAEIRP